MPGAGRIARLLGRKESADPRSRLPGGQSAGHNQVRQKVPTPFTVNYLSRQQNLESSISDAIVRADGRVHNCNMQQLKELSVASAESCAAEILETIPSVLQFIRTQMRSKGNSDLSVPQFRALMLLHRRPGASLSAVAEFLGQSLPAASRLVEGMVRKGYVARRIPSGNRRMVSLALSAAGRRAARSAQQTAEERLANLLASLSARECAAIQRSLWTLRAKVQLEPVGPKALRPRAQRQPVNGRKR